MTKSLIYKSFVSSALLLMAMSSFNSYAKEADDKAIGAVKLKITSDYSAGDEADDSNFSVSSNTEGVQVDSFELLYEMASKENGEWSRYDTPILLVSLTADDGYYFNKAGNKSGWSFTDENATFMSSDVSSDKYEVELKIMIDSLKGEIGNPYNLSWKNTSVGHWTKGYKNSKYKVELYYEDDKVFSGDTSNTYFDFRDNMHKAGNYYFSVQGVRGNNSTDYVDSDSIYIDDVQAADLANGLADNSKKSGNNAGYISSTGPTPIPSLQNNGMTPGWHQEGTNWYYIRSNGSRATSNWELINNKWYMFDMNGIMMTGLQNIGGEYYYLANSGEMLTGWHNINGVDYYFTSSGARAHDGWQLIDNKWYLFDATGKKLTGWQFTGNHWYYLEADGKMKTGWFTDLDNKTYFLQDSGEMAVGSAIAAGVHHEFAASGELIK